MNERFKFRGWHTVSNQFYYFSLDDFGADNVFVSDGNKIGFNPNRFIPFKEFVIQQYSGLIDKNDREIYEGDFIKFLGKWDKEGNVIPPDYIPYKVVWFMGGLRAIRHIGPRSFYKHNDNMGVGHTDNEVIGNVYETPELWRNL
jgi:uncharacterized phage protein (TIGR01671 family)